MSITEYTAKKRWPIYLAAIFILIGAFAVVCLALSYFTVHGGSPQYRNGMAFLTELLEGREDAALDYLGLGLRGAVHSECPNGSLMSCVEQVIPAQWGDIEEILFVVGSGSRNTLLFHTRWGNLDYGVVSIVLIMDEEHGKWVVEGWRGFVLSEGEEADSQLLRGIRHDNEFPKPF
ncbi:MAG: hypothetical protein M5R40_17630 [Anaerolineae bacterium]|nr:hypothetical protein [Anaerolineae bacterium]